MQTYTTRAREGESHPLQVLWCDQLGRPLEVTDVTYSVFYYEGGIRTFLSVVDTPMSPTDQTHRFISRFEIPADTAGRVLYSEYTATLVSDDTTLKAEQVIQIEKDLAQQKLSVRF